MRINEMRRWLVQICVLLIRGAIVNVVVAWGCVLWSPFEEGKGEVQQVERAFPQPAGHTHWYVLKWRSRSASRLLAVPRPMPMSATAIHITESAMYTACARYILHLH